MVATTKVDEIETKADGTTQEVVKEVKSGPQTDKFIGQEFETDHYTVQTEENAAFQGVAKVRLKGGVGEVFIIPASEVKEVAGLLGKLKALPKAHPDDSKKDESE